MLNGYGKLKYFKYKPIINFKVKLIRKPNMAVLLAMRDDVAKELDGMEIEKTIEKSDASPWVSNLVIAKKKDDNIRLRVGLGTVNKAIITSSYPLPTFKEIVAKLHGSKYFCKLNMRRDYLQVPLNEESHYITAFFYG